VCVSVGVRVGVGVVSCVCVCACACGRVRACAGVCGRVRVLSVRASVCDAYEATIQDTIKTQRLQQGRASGTAGKPHPPISGGKLMMLLLRMSRLVMVVAPLRAPLRSFSLL
jgi:hypothetical protein